MSTFILNWIMCGMHYEVDNELSLATNRTAVCSIVKCRILSLST